MKTEKNILIAFILNLAFSVFEFFGGIFTGSVAIVSDALHDVGDAFSIGVSFLLEKKSKKAPDETYTYGYGRYSLLGSFVMTLILVAGSLIVIYNAIEKVFNPSDINYDGMIVFAVIGVIVNFCAAFFTKGEGSLNQRAVNLHMMEDVLGWLTVLVGAVVMKFTDFRVIDPLMSIGVSVFILANALRNLKEIADVFLEKTPHNIKVGKVEEEIKCIEGVLDVHHIHIRSFDGEYNFATVHVVTNSDTHEIKHEIREKLISFGISHITIETEEEGEECNNKLCRVEVKNKGHHNHH